MPNWIFSTALLVSSALARTNKFIQIDSTRDEHGLIPHKNYNSVTVFEREDPSFIQGLYFDTEK